MAGVRLFVYGSLKRGGRHHDELRGARFLGEASTAPGYALVSLGDYLALVASPGAGSVRGELFEVDEAQLPELDAFEGADYVRGSVALLAAQAGEARQARQAPEAREDWGDAVVLAYLGKAR